MRVMYTASLAAEYDTIVGALAEEAWRLGVLAELADNPPPAGTTVLDLGAGTGIGGRLLGQALPDLRRVGVDSSASMLTYAKGHYDEIIEADLRLLPSPASSAALAVSGFGALNYLDREGLAAVFDQASRCLTQGGRLIFDYSSPALLRGWPDAVNVEYLTDGSVQWRRRFEPEYDRCVTVWERYDQSGGLAWSERHLQYALDAFELTEVAADSGLRVDAMRDLTRPECSPLSAAHVWTLTKE